MDSAIETQVLRAVVRAPTGACLSVGGIGPSGAWIGRSRDCDIIIDDPARVVSARHCRIDFADGRYWVTDHSRNGTTLNGAPLPCGLRQAIEQGDVLGTGGFTIALEARAVADPADAVAPAANLHPAWDLDDAVTAAPRLPSATGADPLHHLLDDLIAQPTVIPDPQPIPVRTDDPATEGRLTLYVPDGPRPSNPAVAPFWYGLGVAPPPLGSDDPAGLMIELGAALRALSEGLGRRLGSETVDAPNPLLAGPETLRQFLAIRTPQGPALDKLVRAALARLDAQEEERRKRVRSALDTALRAMTPRAVEARFGGMIRGWRRRSRRLALLDLLTRMEDELVDMAETRFMREIDTPSATSAGERTR